MSGPPRSSRVLSCSIPTRGGAPCNGGEPVDLPTGLFSHSKTDLSVPDVMPINLTRTYATEDANSRPFGVGATHPYEIFLWSANQYQEADLILLDQSRIHYVRTSPGTDFQTAVFEHRAPDATCPTCVGSPAKYYGSKIVYAGPENKPTCWPVTTANVPGWASRRSDSLSPFWLLRAATSSSR